MLGSTTNCGDVIGQRRCDIDRGSRSTGRKGGDRKKVGESESIVTAEGLMVMEDVPFLLRETYPCVTLQQWWGIGLKVLRYPISWVCSNSEIREISNYLKAKLTTELTTED